MATSGRWSNNGIKETVKNGTFAKENRQGKMAFSKMHEDLRKQKNTFFMYC